MLDYYHQACYPARQLEHGQRLFPPIHKEDRGKNRYCQCSWLGIRIFAIKLHTLQWWRKANHYDGGRSVRRGD